MRSIIINDIDKLNRIKKKWETLYQSLPYNCVFHSYTWISSWVEQEKLHNSLFIIAFLDDKNEFIAIFPLYIKKSTLKFIADTHSDYSNFIIKNLSTEKYYFIFKTFSKLVKENNSVQSIELKNLYDHKFFGILFQHFDNKKFFFQSNGYSYMEFESGQQLFDCFKHLNSHKLKGLKKIYNKNSKYESKILESTTESFPKIKIKNLIEIMITNGKRDIDFLNEKLLRVMEALFYENKLIINEIFHNNRIVCMNFIIKHDDSSYTLWVSVYDNIRNIHLYSYLKFFENLCSKEHKYYKIDFGRGLYDYKISNFLPQIYLQYTFFYSKKQIFVLIFLIKIFLKIYIKNLYKNIKNKLKK